MNNDFVANFFKENIAREKKQKIEEYKRRNLFVEKGQILFAGSSLMENFAINELIQEYKTNKKIYNRGVGGFIMDEFIENIDTCCYDLEPSKMFLNIGTNDLNDSCFDIDKFMSKYNQIVTMILTRFPSIKLYVMAYYPVNADCANPYIKKLLENRTNEKINMVNEQIKKMTEIRRIGYINLNDKLTDNLGRLKEEYSSDGLHFYANGYKAILPELIKYINDEIKGGIYGE